jgi:heme exporter protein C
LRNAIDEEGKRAALSAVYAIFSFLTVPFLIFILPRAVPSLHPTDSIVDADMKFTMGPIVGTIFASSLVIFSALFWWIFSLALRIRKIERARMEED